ncbi:MAG: o-succinylbenzoate synthase [Flavobacteriaceae bacterium]
MRATYKKYLLEFKRPSGTSRGVLTQKETWFLILENKGEKGIGECGLLRGLSIDDRPDYEEQLQWVCANITLGEVVLLKAMERFPSIQFGIEQAFLSLAAENPFELFQSGFTKNEAPIAINGLIWMGDKGFMMEQISQKIAEGFHCLKMKIGAIDFETEVGILETIRKKYPKEKIELRVDANGAFQPEDALDKLKRLAAYDLHSVEQPIKPGNWAAMQKLCEKTVLPIALDEELIGVFGVTEKENLLQTIRPQYVILKPSFVGGFAGGNEWISLALKYNIGWWITSALESNIGLNAIAQWTATLRNKMPQGLGTGSLYANNFESPLHVKNGELYYIKNEYWKSELIEELCI